jgi:hypothetical protein
MVRKVEIRSKNLKAKEGVGFREDRFKSYRLAIKRIPQANPELLRRTR